MSTSQPPAGDAGTTGQQRRFHDSESVKHPEEITDPGSLQHEDDESRWDRLKEKKWLLIIGGIVSFSLGIVFIAQLVRWLPELLSSRRFQITSGGMILSALVFWFADKRRQQVIGDKDWLTLKTQTNDDVEYWGEYYEGGRVVPPRFAPMKDAGRFGTKEEPLTVEELDPVLAQKWAGNAPDNEPDDPAFIWLSEPFLDSNESDRGTSYIQLTKSGLEVDVWGDSAVLRATPPDIGGDEQIAEYESILSATRDEVSHLREKEQRLHRHLKELKEMDDPVEDRLEAFLDRWERMMYATDGRRTRRPGENSREDPLADRFRDEPDNFEFDD